MLLDVHKPEHAKIIEVLWKRSKALDVAPRWPVYQPETRRCFFAGEGLMERSLCVFKSGDSLGAKPLVVEKQRPRDVQHLSGLSFSPDGRYLLFTANRPQRR